MLYCAAKCPGSSRLCQLGGEHDGEHRTELTPGRTYLYWYGSSFPVRCGTGTLWPSPPVRPFPINSNESTHDGWSNR